MTGDPENGSDEDLYRSLSDELFQELRGKVAFAFSPAMRSFTRGRRLKAGGFRRNPLEIRIPALVSHPAPFLFRPDELASLLTLSDRISGRRLRRILLLPEFYQAKGQVLAAALPEADTLVFYLCPVRLFLQRGDARSIWGGNEDFLFEALFRFLEEARSGAEAPEGALFFAPTVTGAEVQAMQQIHDRFVLQHPLHLLADPSILSGGNDVGP